MLQTEVLSTLGPISVANSPAKRRKINAAEEINAAEDIKALTQGHVEELKFCVCGHRWKSVMATKGATELLVSLVSIASPSIP